uniref:Dynein regulatory complex protein 12 n=1 Tax=Tetraselmis sp. GSL018 TaxID=582737 RepID=A0A061RAJ1_9CHLO|mmetsp:Transcript_31119/g.73979  ORF Transcript_31119/g.73979 Transcript_31119/m.73979 type:complete len:174 (-) Transcript_31119:853-1374(-)|eukprot:CAMPEP_0177595826 /NCGR_PEP_ID=MMETSP0419_2-20121207/10612_1 /TAXON_ID=582737 /ORGANISM="Tetraselmis sp., Strain GSL018" /LENGTH=173 /DNA_ID=CAMNT_0019087409 /DNA_START=269 /DNA_END=790 /DNA_ORIENTATION=+
MAPKKKKGSKDVAAAKFVDKENLRRAEVEILSLQQLAEQRSADALEARQAERAWRERVDAYGMAIEQQREDTLDITSDMLRQYKAMQEKLLNRIDGLEKKNKELLGQVDDREGKIRELQEELSKERSERQEEVRRLNGTIEQMQGEFAEMLKETLDKMYDKLDAAHSDTKLQI